MKNTVKLIAVVLLTAATAVSAAELKVPAGSRAVVIAVLPSEISRIKRGDRIDMVVTLFSGQAQGPEAATILQNALVLDTVNKSRVSCVVLSLNPTEAQYALLAQSEKYRINLIVRGKGDEEVAPMETATFKRLFKSSGEEKVPEKGTHEAAVKPERP